MDFVKYTPWFMPMLCLGAVLAVPLVREPAQVQMDASSEKLPPMAAKASPRQSRQRAPPSVAKMISQKAPRARLAPPKIHKARTTTVSNGPMFGLLDLRALWLALAQFVAAGLQARWTRKAVEVAKEAAEAARGSADVAKRTADIMEQNAERDLRAYVSLGGPKLTDVEAGKKPAAEFNVINSGRTPAQNVQIAIACYASEKFDAAMALPPAVPPGASNAFIGISQRMPSRIVLSKSPISVDLFNAVKDGRYEIFVYGTITYDDSFRRGRTTDFRLAFNAKNIAEKKTACTTATKATAQTSDSTQRLQTARADTARGPYVSPSRIIGVARKSRESRTHTYTNGIKAIRYPLENCAPPQ